MSEAYRLMVSENDTYTELYGGDLLQLDQLLPGSYVRSLIVKELEDNRLCYLGLDEARQLLVELDELDLVSAVNHTYTRDANPRSRRTHLELINQLTAYLRQELESRGLL